MSITAVAMTMFDTAVLHPALKFTAVREKGPAIGVDMCILAVSDMRSVSYVVLQVRGFLLGVLWWI